MLARNLSSEKLYSTYLYPSGGSYYTILDILAIFLQFGISFYYITFCFEHISV